MTDTLPSKLRTKGARNQRQQQNDYLIILQKLRHLKQTELLENNRRLAREKAGLSNVPDEVGIATAMKVKALTQLILTYYANLDESQKRSVEKILSIDKFTDSQQQRYINVETQKSQKPTASSYCMSIDRTQTRERQRRRSTAVNSNFTCEEYGDWLKTKPGSDEVSDLTMSTGSSVNPSQEMARASSVETSLENYSLATPSKVRKSSVTSSTSELYQEDLPKPSVKLTNSRNRNSELDESKLNVVDIAGRAYGGTDPQVGRLWSQGYLNLGVHYLAGDSQLADSARQKFYCVIRLDEQAVARTCTSKRSTETKSKVNRVDFNEQFMVGLCGKTFFDFVLCHFIEKKPSETKKKKEKSCQTELRYFSQKINLINLIKMQKGPNDKSYFRISLKDAEASNTIFNVLLSITYVVDYSLIHQIFSSRKNSKIFSLPLNDESNKFELIVYKCIHEIETRGLQEPFIYELDTCLTDIKWAILQLERDFFTILQHLPDINAVANVLREMLKELHDPIFTNSQVYSDFKVLWNESMRKAISPKSLFFLIINFIDQHLSFVNKAIFYSIIQHLRQIATNSKQYGIKRNKLASVFARLLFKTEVAYKNNSADEEVISFLIDNWKILDSRK